MQYNCIISCILKVHVNFVYLICLLSVETMIRSCHIFEYILLKYKKAKKYIHLSSNNCILSAINKWNNELSLENELLDDLYVHDVLMSVL